MYTSINANFISFITYEGLRFKIFVQLGPALIYDANEVHGARRLTKTIDQLHTHIKLSLATKEYFQSDYPSTTAALRFDNYLYKNVI